MKQFAFLQDANALTRPVETNKADGFRILELHNTDATVDNAPALAAALDATLEQEKPDLVVFCGDVTMGPADADTLKQVLTVLTAPLENRQIPWTNVFGDDERTGKLDIAAQLPVYQSFAHCLTIAGPRDIDGIGNYMVPVVHDGKLLCAVWGMETGAHVETYEKQYHSPHRARLGTPLYTEHYLDGVRFNQTMWYWHASQELEQNVGAKVPGLLFCHVSTVEHTIISMNALPCEMKGEQWENLATQTVCGGLFSAVMERGDVQGIYCGHTHRNHTGVNFTGRYAGVQLGLTAGFAVDTPRYRTFTLQNGRFVETIHNGSVTY